MYRKWNRPINRPTWSKYKNLQVWTGTDMCRYDIGDHVSRNTWQENNFLGHFWLDSFRSIIEIEFLMGLKWKLNDSTQIEPILRNIRILEFQWKP